MFREAGSILNALLLSPPNGSKTQAVPSFRKRRLGSESSVGEHGHVQPRCALPGQGTQSIALAGSLSRTGHQLSHFAKVPPFPRGNPCLMLLVSVSIQRPDFLVPFLENSEGHSSPRVPLGSMEVS